MIYFLVFFATAVTDFVWAMYINANAEKRAVAASLWSGGIIVIGSWVVKTYVDDFVYVVPAAAGAVVGTYVSMQWKEIWGKIECLLAK